MRAFFLISETLSANPSLDLKTWYALKLSLVVGYYRKGCRLGLRGDPPPINSGRRLCPFPVFML